METPFCAFDGKVPRAVVRRRGEVHAACGQVCLPRATGIVIPKREEVDNVICPPIHRAATCTPFSALGELIRALLARTEDSLNIGSTQSHRVVESQRVVGSVRIKIGGCLETQRVFRQEPPRCWIIVAFPVVLDSRFWIELTACVLEWIYERAGCAVTCPKESNV